MNCLSLFPYSRCAPFSEVQLFVKCFVPRAHALFCLVLPCTKVTCSFSVVPTVSPCTLVELTCYCWLQRSLSTLLFSQVFIHPYLWGGCHDSDHNGLSDSLLDPWLFYLQQFIITFYNYISVICYGITWQFAAQRY